MNTGPTYTPRNHKYDPFQQRLGNAMQLTKLPPKTLVVTPELMAHYAKK